MGMAHVPGNVAMREDMPLIHQTLPSPSSLSEAATGPAPSDSARPPSGANATSTTTATSLWQKLTRVSVFAFSREELENAFHADMERHVNLGDILLPCCILGAWIIFLVHYVTSPMEVRAFLPKGWPMAAMHPLVAILSLSLQVSQTQMYVTHQKALRLGFILILISASCQTREVVLRFRMYRGEQPDVSYIALAQAFVGENLYFSTAWIGHATVNIGQLIDLLMAALFLVTEIRSNARICASTSGGSPVGTSGARLAEAACAPVRAWLGLPSPLQRSVDPSACPASLRFWQVLGAWLACIAVLLKDVLHRRAFLRSNTASALIPQQHREAAEAWPFTSLAGGALVLWASMCLALLPYLLQLGTLYCIALP